MSLFYLQNQDTSGPSWLFKLYRSFSVAQGPTLRLSPASLPLVALQRALQSRPVRALLLCSLQLHSFPVNRMVSASFSKPVALFLLFFWRHFRFLSHLGFVFSFLFLCFGADVFLPSNLASVLVSCGTQPVYTCPEQVSSGRSLSETLSSHCQEEHPPPLGFPNWCSQFPINSALWSSVYTCLPMNLKFSWPQDKEGKGHIQCTLKPCSERKWQGP